ncbi:RNA polymerase sigma factor [Paenibacillus thermotolerans]|uniref:RNA polymerase sigma factor n=1 Tax=Paenibacillus thermotolerans TaxID=3027807 RepID=UPI0023684EFB|nr:MULTISPECIES: sigma-70 family RNA polymerase sigma factor [unclassified Paenibacillus]
MRERLHFLVTRYHSSVFKYCYHMLRHKEEAEDAVQEVFLKALKADPKDKRIRSDYAWLLTIAHNHCLNVIRRKRLYKFIPFRVEQPSQADGYEAVEQHSSIHEILSHIPPLDRSILLLRIIEDKSYEEIGGIVQAAPATVRKRFERAKTKIRKKYIAEGGVSDESEAVSFIRGV